MSFSKCGHFESHGHLEPTHTQENGTVGSSSPNSSVTFGVHPRPSLSLWQPLVCFCPYSLTFARVLYKWNRAFEIHPCCRLYAFNCRVVFHYVGVLQFIHSLVEEDLGYFQFGVSTDECQAIF